MRYHRLPQTIVAFVLLGSGASTAYALDAPATTNTAMTLEQRQALLDRLNAPPGWDARFLVGLGAGGGLRFNNPYRLATQTGSTGESLSTTAPYVMLTTALAFGPADGLQHGGFLSFSFAQTGVDQTLFTPGYMVLYRGPSRWMGYARLGPAIVLSPQANVGGELALGGAFFLTGSFGVSLDLAGDLFYGASTWQKKYPAYPVVSATLGFIVDFEVLP